MDSNDVLFEEIEVTKVEGYSSESEIETYKLSGIKCIPGTGLACGAACKGFGWRILLRLGNRLKENMN